MTDTRTTRKPATPQIVPGTVSGAVMVKLGDQPGFDAEFYGYNARRNAKRLIAYQRLFDALGELADAIAADVPGASDTKLVKDARALLAELGE